MIPVGVRGRLLLRFYTDAGRLLLLLNGFGVLMVAATLAIISIRHLRAAVVLLFLVVYFAGYPALQFHARHFFHLEFITWFAVAFLADRIVTAALQYRTLSWGLIAAGAWRGGAFAASAAVLLVALFAIARTYQGAHTRNLLRDAYLGADREAVMTTTRRIASGRVLVDASNIWRPRAAGAPVGTEYLVAQFSGHDCDAIQVPATFRYQAARADFSRDLDVRLRPGAAPTVVMLQVFDSPGFSQFSGIELPIREARCLTGVYRMKTNQMPRVLLDVNAPASWERAKLYQTLAAWESSSDGDDTQPRLYSHARNHALRPAASATPFQLKGPQLEYRNTIVSDGDDGFLHIAGRPDTPASAVLVLKDEPLRAGDVVVARGEVKEGGIALGLFRDGRTIDAVEVTNRGGFEAAVAVPATGRYTVSLANRVAGRWRRRNDVTITSFGWIPGDAVAAGSAP